MHWQFFSNVTIRRFENTNAQTPFLFDRIGVATNHPLFGFESTEGSHTQAIPSG
jgi:hypothetical protein